MDRMHPRYCQAGTFPSAQPLRHIPYNSPYSPGMPSSSYRSTPNTPVRPGRHAATGRRTPCRKEQKPLPRSHRRRACVASYPTCSLVRRSLRSNVKNTMRVPRGGGDRVKRVSVFFDDHPSPLIEARACDLSRRPIVARAHGQGDRASVAEHAHPGPALASRSGL